MANAQRILVISERPVFCQGLKLLIEKAVVSVVTTALNKVSAGPLVTEFTPHVIVIDCPDSEAVDDLSFCFQHKDYPVKVIVAGWNDDKIAVYSRATVQPATIESLIRAIKGC